MSLHDLLTIIIWKVISQVEIFTFIYIIPMHSVTRHVIFILVKNLVKNMSLEKMDIVVMEV